MDALNVNWADLIGVQWFIVIVESVARKMLNISFSCDLNLQVKERYYDWHFKVLILKWPPDLHKIISRISAFECFCKLVANVCNLSHVFLIWFYPAYSFFNVFILTFVSSVWYFVVNGELYVFSIIIKKCSSREWNSDIHLRIN